MRETSLLFIVLTEYCSSSCLFANVHSSLKLNFRQYPAIHTIYTVTLRDNAVVGSHLLGPPYRRGALWDPVDLFDIVIPRLPAPRYPKSQAKA